MKPVMGSSPMVISSRPSSVLTAPLSMFFDAMDTTIVRPKMASAKYSGGPNASAALASGTEKAIRMKVPRMPPVQLAMSAVPSARPGSPRLVSA